MTTDAVLSDGFIPGSGGSSSAWRGCHVLAPITTNTDKKEKWIAGKERRSRVSKEGSKEGR
jgi:hypothetical protein